MSCRIVRQHLRKQWGRERSQAFSQGDGEGLTSLQTTLQSGQFDEKVTEPSVSGSRGN